MTAVGFPARPSTNSEFNGVGRAGRPASPSATHGGAPAMPRPSMMTDLPGRRVAGLAINPVRAWE